MFENPPNPDSEDSSDARGIIVSPESSGTWKDLNFTNTKGTDLLQGGVLVDQVGLVGVFSYDWRDVKKIKRDNMQVGWEALPRVQ